MSLATPRALPLFFKEVFDEIRDQQAEEPTNKNLVIRLKRQSALAIRALKANDDPAQIVQELVQVAAFAARIASEGDPEYKKYRWPYE